MRLHRIIFIAIFLIALPQPAHAQLLIEQGKVKLDVVSGTTIADKLTVHNTSNATVQVKAYWEDFLYASPFTGKKNFLPEGSTEYSCGKWISFSPREFTLAPYAKRNIEYTLKIPKENRGGHYGVLFVEQQGGTLDGMAGVKIVARVGTLFFLEPVDKKKLAKVDGIEIADKKIKGLFSNQGDIILIPTGTYYIMDGEGIVQDRGEITKFYLPPGEKVEFNVEPANNLKAGKFTAVVNFDLDEGKVLLKEIDFEKDSSGNFKILELRN